MKASSEPNNPNGKVNRETALGLLASNIAVPGVGTFLAGRRVSGAIQIILMFVGLAMTLFFGAKLVIWMLGNWDALHDPYADPWQTLHSILDALKWPLAGIALFGISWLWAFMDGMRTVQRTSSAKPKPPKIQG